MPESVSSLELSRRFYHEAVHPILDVTFPELPHAAGLLGRGSEVLGFDDDMSMDHDWTSRVLLFLRDEDDARHGDSIRDTMRARLPRRLHRHPTEVEVHTTQVRAGVSGIRHSPRDRAA